MLSLLILVLNLFFTYKLVICSVACGVCREYRFKIFKMVLSIGFPYFTNIVQLLCSLSGWLHLNCSSVVTGFNGA